MELASHRFLVVVGPGGVGKTTLAAAFALGAARQDEDTLVMTFDPSRRLKDALGIGDATGDAEVPVQVEAPGRLAASLLDARATFDRLVRRYTPDETAQRRILDNRFYRRLAGNLAGVLEYMAVERLYEVAQEDRYRKVVLDTPPTRQALDFLEAPERIVSFLDSGALRLALRPWFDESGHLRLARHLWGFGAKLEGYLDSVVGLELLREMVEFFQAFGPLYDGFRERALEVQRLLRSPDTLFVLVSRAAEDAHAETMFFARRLEQAGYHLGAIVLNRTHPRLAVDADHEALELFRWLGERDRVGAEKIRALLPDHPVVEVPLLAHAPTNLEALGELSTRIGREAAA